MLGEWVDGGGCRGGNFEDGWDEDLWVMCE